MSESTSGDKATSSAGELEDVLALVAAHAQHVATQLPCGQLGTQAAEAFLAAIAGAVRLRLADVTGTATSIVEIFVAHGLLPVLPNPKVSRAIPRLLAPLTPLVEARSARLWTLWLTSLQDPRSPLVAKLRKATPAAALVVRPPAPTARVQTARALAAERDAFAAQVAALHAERAELTAQLAARAEEQRQIDDPEAATSSELERVAEFYEAQLREAEARAIDAERHVRAAAELAELRAFLQQSAHGQELLQLFARRRAPK